MIYLLEPWDKSIEMNFMYLFLPHFLKSYVFNFGSAGSLLLHVDYL